MTDGRASPKLLTRIREKLSHDSMDLFKGVVRKRNWDLWICTSS